MAANLVRQLQANEQPQSTLKLSWTTLILLFLSCAASATEVLLEHACDPDAQCLDSGIPRCCQVSLEPQPNCHSRTRLRLMVKRQQQAPAEEGSPPDGPPTPELQAPAFASQESSDSANTQRCAVAHVCKFRFGFKFEYAGL